MMKKIFKNLGGALMLAAALVFTSCDEIKSFIDNPVSSYLEVNPESVTLKVGEEKALEVTTISGQPITYTSSNKDVATVDEKGVITAVSEGDAIITVSVASTDTYAAGTKQVQVKVVDPLTIEAKAENGATVKLRKSNSSLELEKTIKYKKSTDTSWKDYQFDDEISLNKGESVSFWSNNAALAQRPSGSTFYSYFDISDECYVYGNVMSMIDDQEGATAENPKFSTDEEIGASRALYYLFRNCKKILNHESKELVLPATKLEDYCYYGMFYNCEKLTKAPDLKAKALKRSCYNGMFYGCSLLTEAPEIAAETVAPYCCAAMFLNCQSLTKAPVLKAKKLEEYCYNSMFMGCTSLTKAPDLKAKELKDNCYESMFSGCTSLTDAPEIAAETVAPHCCKSMFYNCTSLTKAPELKAETLEESCYESMFSGCSSLTKAPDLKAKTLKESCYRSMFGGCSSLTEAPEIAAETVARYCCQYMFSGCKLLTEGPVLKAKTLEKGCYNGMFNMCYKLGSLTCLATDITADYCVMGWLNSAGSQAEGDKILYVDKSMTGAGWNPGGGWKVESAVN